VPSQVIRPTEAPEPAPFTFTLGATESFAPESVAASWDGAGAGGPFLPCVSYYRGGVLVDRAFPDGVVMQPGDTADVFYRPFKRTTGGGAAPVATQFEGIIDNTGVLVAPNTSTALPWFHDFGDSLLGFIGTSVPDFAAAGTYAVTVFASGGVAGAPYDLTMQFRVPRTGPTFQSFVAEARWLNVAISGQGPVVAITKTFAAGDSMDVHVLHNAATNVRVFLTAAVAKLT
jgi:hypothetical protein